MRLVMWFFTIVFALAGLALRDDGGFGLGNMFDAYAPFVSQGLFILAVLACPFFWAPRYQMIPRTIAPTGRQRFMLALALLIATPLLLPWPF
jgi:hypothetical protein